MATITEQVWSVDGAGVEMHVDDQSDEAVAVRVYNTTNRTFDLSARWRNGQTRTYLLTPGTDTTFDIPPGQRKWIRGTNAVDGEPERDTDLASLAVREVS